MPDLLLRDALPPAQREVRDAWEEIAPEYGAFVARLGARRLRAIDRPLLRIASGDVLEVGCGDGRLLARIERRRVQSVTGVDFARGMAEAARARGIDAYLAAAERLPFADASFDTVLSGFYSLRFADLEAALGEIGRVLRPGGRFGITLLGRRGVELAARAMGLRMLPDREAGRHGARLLFGREDGVRTPSDVEDLCQLRDRLARRGLEARVVLGTVPLLGPWLPYLRGGAAARWGYDVVALGRAVH